MNSRLMLVFVALSGFFYVAFGAFSAHELRTTLSSHEMVWIRTGLEY